MAGKITTGQRLQLIALFTVHADLERKRESFQEAAHSLLMEVGAEPPRPSDISSPDDQVNDFLADALFTGEQWRDPIGAVDDLLKRLSVELPDG